MEEEIESGRKKETWFMKFTSWQTDCHIGEGGEEHHMGGLRCAGMIV